MTAKDPDPLDELLVMAAQDGDGSALTGLVQRWQRRLWCHACRLACDPEAAWDITQEAWLAIAKGLGRLHDPARFGAWAYRIVTNKAMDFLKAARPAQPIGDRPAETVRSAHDDVLDLLARLDPDKRAVLVLYYLDDLDVAEVASILGIPPGTVKSRLFSAREAFRALWQQEGGHR